MYKKIILLLNEGFFTQHLHEFQNINLDVVVEELNKSGFEVEFLEYKDLARYDYEIDASVIYWAGSHQNISVKQYINDVLVARFLGRSNLVPALGTILAHENKGIMGILAAERGLPFVSQNYHLSRITAPNHFDYPFVYKALGGAGSKGVSLIHKSSQLVKALRSTMLLDASMKEIREGIKNRIRRLLKRTKQAHYLTQQARFCEQTFIPNLSSDYKVLVFWDKVYVLKREVRNGDFRASGSGMFEIQTTIDPVLAELAIDCRKKLNSPYCSLDFVQLLSGEYQLIEFQTCHFGPYTQMTAEFFYNDSLIKSCSGSESFEENMIYAILKCLNEIAI